MRLFLKATQKSSRCHYISISLYNNAGFNSIVYKHVASKSIENCHCLPHCHLTPPLYGSHALYLWFSVLGYIVIIFHLELLLCLHVRLICALNYYLLTYLLISAQTLYCQKLDSLGHISATDSMGFSSLKFPWWTSRKCIFWNRVHSGQGHSRLLILAPIESTYVTSS